VGRPGLEVLAEERLIDAQGQVTANKYAATIYPGPKGNLVFNASTMWWPQFLNVGTRLPFPGDAVPRFTSPTGLLAQGSADMQRVEQITVNLFDMLRG
jgi:hypothetical protein